MVTCSLVCYARSDGTSKNADSMVWGLSFEKYVLLETSSTQKIPTLERLGTFE